MLLRFRPAKTCASAKKKKEKRKKTDYRRVISNQQGMMFFSLSCDMYCLENNQSRVAFVLGYVHTT